MQAHEFAAARDIADRVLERSPSDVTALILRGDALLELGEYEDSVTAYQRAADLRPDLRSYDRGAWMRWLNGDPQGALDLLALAIDSGSIGDPESSAWCYVDLATIQWNGNHLEQVRVALEAALVLVPE